MPPPPQLDQSPTLATSKPRQSREPRRRRGEANPVSTIAGIIPIAAASIHGELECISAAVVVRVMVSVAVVVVPAAPRVIVGGENEHDNPAGRPAQERTRVCPATAAFGVNDTVN